MPEKSSRRGLYLGTVVCVLAALLIITTFQARADTVNWGAIIVLGVIGPVIGMVLAILGGVAFNRADTRLARLVAGTSIWGSVAGIICALTLFIL